ncbi:MAG: tyrosine--tRNA ligase [Methanomicrobia archaeon]|nr:tyrosine--tRNA ligase [Methanomicrobia archaeon]
MDIEEKIKLVNRVPTEEVITQEELRNIFETNDSPLAYQGFEPSGLAHLGTGLVTALKTIDMINAGIKFILFLADWHAWINEKMGGNMELIRKSGEYLKEVWISLGVDKRKVKFIWASDLCSDLSYWEKVIRITKSTTIARMTRCLTIMGRKEGEMQNVAQYIYPAMQASDILQMDLDIACAGMDQRKAHMLVREMSEKLKLKKPTCVHYHLLMGLTGPKASGFDKDSKIDISISSKMSKSSPKANIFVHDSEEEIKEKIKDAYCPAKITENNPILEIAEYIIFRGEEKEFTVHRPEKFGGDVTFWCYTELEDAFRKGELHPLDLKNSVAETLIDILEPCRKHFKNKKEIIEVLLKGVSR